MPTLPLLLVSAKFFSMCVRYYIQFYYNFCRCLLQANGTIKWRRYPCFCDECFNLNWSECRVKEMVGDMKIVKTNQ